MNKKAITPIISVILLLMMAVAVSGIAWFWLQSMTHQVMSKTETATTTTLGSMVTTLQNQGCTCVANTSLTFILYNSGSEDVKVSSVVADGNLLTASGTISANSAAEITATGDATSVGECGVSRAVTINTDAGSLGFTTTC